MANAYSLIATVGGAIAILWVIATVVRRQRPDAYRPLLWWAIGSLVATLVSFAAYPLISFYSVKSSSLSSMETYLDLIGAFQAFNATVHVVLVVVLVRGLVAIAQPPKAVRVESDAP